VENASIRLQGCIRLHCGVNDMSSQLAGRTRDQLTLAFASCDDPESIYTRKIIEI
ncbi:MAG: hypothetical protein ACI8P9_004925, partial [Parasphingorhabdus sp.]